MHVPSADARLSIVVPMLDEASAIGLALGALQPLRAAAGMEVIVVDGGSRDGTPALAARLADRVLTAPRGRAVQMNVGAAAATGDVLLFLHADCRLPERARESILSALAAGARWGRFDVTLAGRSPWLPIVAALMNARSRLTSIATGDQGMFVERRTFEVIGGFPPLPLMEDVTMSRVLRERAGPPACLAQRIVASGRRWDRDGALRTIVAMSRLRYACWRGADPADLARRYEGRSPAAVPTLCVFGKAPISGQVKTRLAATIGADAAAEVYRQLLERTLDTACGARRAGVVADVEFWAAPETRHEDLAQRCAARSITLHVQRGADLGMRMREAIATSLARGRPAIVVGSDVPGYDVPYLAAAASALQHTDAVVGPAEDGGYVLLGLARDVDVFSGVAWSTSGVMDATRERLLHADMRWHELEPLFDIDTHDDLVRWRGAEAAAPPDPVLR